jgi:hypothetical protein
MELKTQIKKQHELSDIYSRLLNFRYGIENEEALRACDRIETELKIIELAIDPSNNQKYWDTETPGCAD